MIIKHDCSLALQYIQEKGYASYSSLKHVRDGTDPYGKFEANAAFDIGTELHANWLEDKSKLKLPAADKKIVKGMYLALNKNKMSILMRAGATTERKIDQIVMGVPFIGYIDLEKPKFLADLKTFGHTNEKKFIEDQDFLQAALYLKASGKPDFFYIGVSKVHPHKVCTFSVSKYKDRLKESQAEMKDLLKFVKKELF